jgi:hypothetical protein
VTEGPRVDGELTDNVCLRLLVFGLSDILKQGDRA